MRRRAESILRCRARPAGVPTCAHSAWTLDVLGRLVSARKIGCHGRVHEGFVGSGHGPVSTVLPVLDDSRLKADPHGHAKPPWREHPDLPLWVRFRRSDVAGDVRDGLALECAVHDVQTDTTQRRMCEGAGNCSDHSKAVPLV